MAHYLFHFIPFYRFWCHFTPFYRFWYFSVSSHLFDASLSLCRFWYFAVSVCLPVCDYLTSSPHFSQTLSRPPTLSPSHPFIDLHLLQMWLVGAAGQLHQSHCDYQTRGGGGKRRAPQAYSHFRGDTQVTLHLYLVWYSNAKQLPPTQKSVPYARLFSTHPKETCIKTQLNFALHAQRLERLEFSFIIFQQNVIYSCVRNSAERLMLVIKITIRHKLINIDFLSTGDTNLVLDTSSVTTSKLRARVRSWLISSHCNSGIVLSCKWSQRFKTGDISMQESTGTSSEKAIWGLHRRSRPFNAPAQTFQGCMLYWSWAKRTKIYFMDSWAGAGHW